MSNVTINVTEPSGGERRVETGPFLIVYWKDGKPRVMTNMAEKERRMVVTGLYHQENASEKDARGEQIIMPGDFSRGILQ